MKYSIWILLFLFCTFCATPKVIKFLNEDLDFSNYKTYRLIHYKSDDKSYDQSGMAFYSEIESAIDQNMKKRGYSTAERPDLIARYEVISTTTTESNAQNYDPYRYNSYYTPRSPTIRTEGIVLIELRDRKQKKLVWQASLDLKSGRRREVEVSILDAINNIFQTYPHQSGSNEKIIFED